MLRLRRPTLARITAQLASLEEAPFSYPEVAATRSGGRALPPSLRKRYDVDCDEVELGRGADLYERARKELFDWAPFRIDWLTLHGARSPLSEGDVVATLSRAAGLWSLNPCRVVYVQDHEPGLAAFAYGTLRGHVEMGEERFQVRFEPESEAVRFEILAISRPRHPLTQLGYPFARKVQARFRRDATEAMLRACEART